MYLIGFCYNAVNYNYYRVSFSCTCWGDSRYPGIVVPGDVRPILAICLYGSGSINKPPTIKVGQHTAFRGVICGGKVGKNAFWDAFDAFVWVWLVDASVVGWCVAVVFALGGGVGAGLGSFKTTWRPFKVVCWMLVLYGCLNKEDFGIS